MKKQTSSKTEVNSSVSKKRNRYESPMIIFEGRITTRAGTIIGSSDTEGDIDPADIFGD